MVILQQVRLVLMRFLNVKLLYLLKGRCNLAAIGHHILLTHFSWIDFSTPVISLNDAALNHVPVVLQWPPCILINIITASRLRFNKPNSSYRVPCFLLNEKPILQKTKYKTKQSFIYLKFYFLHFLLFLQ